MTILLHSLLRCRLLLFVCFFLLLAISNSLLAKELPPKLTIKLDDQEQPFNDYSPLVVDINQLSLADAIRLTLQHNPDIHLQRQVVLSRYGNIQSERGNFDLSLQFDASGEFIQTELTPAQLEAQKEIRVKEQEALENYIEQRDKINAKIESKNPIPEDTEVLDVIIDNETDEEKKQNLTDLRAEAIQIAIDALEEVATEFEKSVTDSRQRLHDLGSVPEVNRDYNSQFKLALKKPLLNGAQVTSKLELSTAASNFRGKEMDDAPIYRSIISFVIDYPLGKGRDFSARSGLFASRLNYRASQYTLHHTIAINVYKTISAYWSLVAAQERHRLLKISADLQSKLVNLSQAQVDADLIPRSEMSRVLAREAVVKATLAQGLQAMLAAQTVLAELTGIGIEDVDNMPQANQLIPIDSTMKEIETLESASLIQYAQLNRTDYQAAKTLENSRYVRIKAARIDLAPQSDLQVEVGYTGIHQDSSIANGLNRLFLGNIAGPSLKAAYKLDWSFDNNSAKGNLASAEANWQQNRIITRNLARTFKTNIVQLVSSLKDSKNRLKLMQEAVEYYSRSMQSELLKFKLGQATLIDTILTEEYLTNAYLDLVSAKEQYIQLISRLRYEAGAILRSTKEQVAVNSDDLIRLPLNLSYERN